MSREFLHRTEPYRQSKL